MRNICTQVVLLSLLLVPFSALLRADTVAADPKADVSEKVDVDQIRRRYWARGDETEMGVVQNQTYSESCNRAGYSWRGIAVGFCRCAESV